MPPITIIMRTLFLGLLAAPTIRGWALSSAPRELSRARGSLTSSLVVPSRSAERSCALFLSDAAPDGEEPPILEPAPKTKTELAADLRRLFDIGEMAYTVMVREAEKGPDGKLTPDQLIAAIQKDSMFGEDFEEYCEKHAGEGDVAILDIGKFSDDMQTSEPLPEDENLVIPGKGNYLVHLSFAEGILATMRVVVD